MDQYGGKGHPTPMTTTIDYDLILGLKILYGWMVAFLLWNDIRG